MQSRGQFRRIVRQSIKVPPRDYRLIGIGRRVGAQWGFGIDLDLRLDGSDLQADVEGIAAASAYIHFGVFRGRESNRECADFVFTRRQSSKAVGAVCIRCGRFLCARRIRQVDGRADNGRAELVGD